MQNLSKQLKSAAAAAAKSLKDWKQIQLVRRH